MDYSKVLEGRLSRIELPTDKDLEIIANIYEKRTDGYTRELSRNDLSSFTLINEFKYRTKINMVSKVFLVNNLIESYYFLVKLLNRKKAQRIYKTLIASTTGNNNRKSELNFLPDKIYDIIENMEPNDKLDYIDQCVDNIDRYEKGGNKLLRLLLKLGYDKFTRILDMLKDKQDMHDFLETIPENTLHNLDDDTFKDEFVKFISETSSSQQFNSFLTYVNFKRVRLAKNNKERSYNTRLLELSIHSNISLVNKDSNIHYLLINEDKITSEELFYSREPKLINTIGKMTNCCFRPDGLAKSLLEPAIKSPLSGILTGNVYNHRVKGHTTWFSFVWEFIEYNMTLGTFTTSLVLDNLEANHTLTLDQWNRIKKQLSENSNYYRIYLGTSRNDIEYGYEDELLPYKENNNRKTRDKPYSLVNYQKNFDSYSYDDSRQMYLVNENKNLEISKVVISKVDRGWMERISFLENYFWKDKNDPYLLNIDTSETPSFVIHSNGQILGYVLTELAYYDTEMKKLHVSLKKKFNIEFKEEEKYQKVCYFTDILFVNNIKLMKTMEPIMEYLTDWLKGSNILYTSASMNSNSKGFKKRLEEVSTFIPDNTFTIPLENQKLEKSFKGLTNNYRIIKDY